MIEIYTESFAGIQTLHAFPGGAREANLDTVVVYHGFMSSKTVYSYFAVALAQAGFRVIMPDAPEHGARFPGNEADRVRHFWQILTRNIQDFIPLRTALQEAGFLRLERLYVAGASMGGMTALGLMAAHADIAAVACLMGSGYYSTLACSLFPPNAGQTVQDEQDLENILAPLKPYEATQTLAALASRPLFLWHGEADDLVPAAETLRLQRALQQQGLDGQLTCVLSEGVTHRITPAALEMMVRFFCEQREASSASTR